MEEYGKKGGLRTSLNLGIARLFLSNSFKSIQQREKTVEAKYSE